MNVRVVLIVLTALVSCAAPSEPVVAEPTSVAAPQPERPVADPADVGSLDAILAAVYDVISGPAGEPRDWDRMASLFHPSARLMPVGRRAADAPFDVFPLTPDEYRERSAPAFAEQGFFEQEIGRRTERFGHIAHVFSTYAARRELSDAEPFMRGVNSIQALWDGERWWILSILWDPERPDQPLPERYLVSETR